MTEQINVIIEIPQGSAIKYELNGETGKLAVDRRLGAADAYPYAYGFIPDTLAGDGDALDALVLSDQKLFKQENIVCRPVAVLKMIDEQGEDNKILCVPIDEKADAFGAINDLPDLLLPEREKISLFFKRYKEAESKRWSKVFDFGGKSEALKVIEQSRLKQ